MKNYVSRVLSLFITAFLLVASVPTEVFAATDATIITNISEVSDLEALIADGTKNIVKGYTPAAKGTPMAYSMEHTYGTVVSQQLTNPRFTERVTDGDLTTSHCDTNSFSQVPAAGEYVEGYVDFTFTFPSTAEITGLLVASSTTVVLTTQSYEVYTSNDLATLYSGDNMVYSYHNTEYSTGQYITFSSPINATYLGIRVTGLVDRELNQNFEYSYCRIREIAVIGSCEIPEEFKIIDTDAAEECIANLKSNSNILQSGYTVGSTVAPSTIIIDGANEGVAVNGGRIGSYTTDNDLLDGDVDTNSDIALNEVNFLDGTDKFRANSYINITFCLREKADITKIFLAQRPETRFMSHKYEIYIANKYEELYNPGNRYWSFTNSTNARYQTFTPAATLSARYVGFRFIEPVTLPDYTLGEVNCYPRLNEIAIFGAYNTPWYDYTVSSTHGNFVADSGNAEDGEVLSYTVPLTKDGYSFLEWQVNGEAVESDIDILGNSSTVTVELLKESNIVAVYENDPTSLSGDRFAISDGKVRLPSNSIAYEATMGFHQHPLNIAVKSGEEFYRGGEYITRDMQVVLFASGEVADTLNIVTAYDYNDDGEVSVTDISAAIEGIFGNNAVTEEEKFAFDGNSSGTITVADIVGARRDILLTPETPVDYTTVTTEMKDFKYKQTGRNRLNSDGSLYIEMPAAGFSFNADCYGDVVATVNHSYSGTHYYTVVVDGVAKDIPVQGSGVQDIILARGLKKGKHTIEFYRCEQSGTNLTIKAVKLNGVNLDAPANSDLYIEFIGDSITSGSGNMVVNGTEIDGRTNNAYLAYGTCTARELTADWSNVSLGGGTLTDQTASGAAYLPKLYKQQYVTGTNTVYDFARKADIVVINLGTNDGSKLHSQYDNDADRSAAFKSELDELVSFILENNGLDTKIVFAYGLMTASETYIDEVYRTAAAELQAEGTNAYHIRLTTRRGGLNGHPNIYEAQEAGKELAEFIRTTVLK